MSVTYDCRDPARRSTGVAAAVGAIRRGTLIVLPTDIAYGLGADAFVDKAMAALRAAKDIDQWTPVAVMVGSPRTLDGIAQVTPAMRRLVEAFWPGSLTLVCNQQPSLTWQVGDGYTVSVRMPLHPLALDVLRQTGPLALTSPVAGPPPTAVEPAREALASQVAVYLDGGPLPAGEPSTILDVTGDVPRVLRHGAVTLDLLRQVVPEVEEIA